MTRDYLTLGSTPTAEPCAQVGQPDYMERTLQEGKRFIRQLIKQFGEPPEGASLRLKGFPHDFGTYHEVVVWYDDDYPKAVDYAFLLEAETPEYWDPEVPE